MKKISIVLMGLFLQGCGESAIDTVKNTYVDLAKTTTYSQMLDNRSICASVNWTEGKDSNQRISVEYTCVFKDGDDFLAPDREITVEQQRNRIDFEIKNLTEEYEAHKRWAEQGFAQKEQDVADLMMEIERKGYLASDDDKRKLETAQSILSKAKSDVEYSRRMVAEFPEKLKTLEERGNEDSIRKHLMTNFPVLNKLREKLQWVVNKDGEASLVHVGFYTDDPSRGEISLPVTNDINRYLETLYKSKASDWKKYAFNEQWLGQFMKADPSWKK